MLRKMTQEEFDMFIAETEDYCGEEELMKLQEEADPEDYGIVIVEKKQMTAIKIKYKDRFGRKKHWRRKGARKWVI